MFERENNYQGSGSRNKRDDKPRGPMGAKPQFFKRRKTCPFSGPGALKIDYKDVKTLAKFLSERGKMIPSRITSVSVKKQRELSKAIKRARFLALIPYVNQ